MYLTTGLDLIVRQAYPNSQAPLDIWIILWNVVWLMIIGQYLDSSVIIHDRAK